MKKVVMKKLVRLGSRAPNDIQKLPHYTFILKRNGASRIFCTCRATAEEFTTRCGFGNAVNTLRLKGRISVPGIG